MVQKQVSVVEETWRSANLQIPVLTSLRFFREQTVKNTIEIDQDLIFFTFYQNLPINSSCPIFQRTRGGVYTYNFRHIVLEHLTKGRDLSRLKMARSSQVQPPSSPSPNVAFEFLRAQSDRNTTLGEGRGRVFGCR